MLFDIKVCATLICHIAGEKMAHWNSLSVSEFITVMQEFLTTNHYDDGDHQLLRSKKVWQYLVITV